MMNHGSIHNVSSPKITFPPPQGLFIEKNQLGLGSQRNDNMRYPEMAKAQDICQPHNLNDLGQKIRAINGMTWQLQKA